MASGSRRMPSNPHVVGRIEESRIDARPVAEEPLQETSVAAIATAHAVIPEDPYIARLGSWCRGNGRE